MELHTQRREIPGINNRKGGKCDAIHKLAVPIGIIKLDVFK